MKKTTLISILTITLLFTGCITINENNKNNNKNNIIKSKILNDTDLDGIPDETDDFPQDPAASKDTDKDGYPDSWNPGKNQEDSTTNLTLDAFPDDPAASIDSDGDGYPDFWNPGKNQDDSTSIPPLELDEYPNDPNDHKDTDKDGVGDYYDINDYVNLSLDISIIKFMVTSRVDLLRWAQVYFEIYIDGKLVKKIDNNGRNWIVRLQHEKIIDEKFHYDISEQTNERYTNIEIKMWDYDFFGENDLIDISYKTGENTLLLKFDNVKNSILSQKNISEGPQGVIWYEIEYPKNKYTQEKYNRSYSWRFKNKEWNIELEIPVETYEEYKKSTRYMDKNGNRIPQKYGKHAMASFVTYNDDTIKTLSNKLENIAEKEEFTDTNTVNFVLKFVQMNIDYKLDNETKKCEEYWKYPVESLVEKQGDCEDTAVLYASIIKALDYDVALLLYEIPDSKSDIGHLAVGIHLENSEKNWDYVTDNSGKKYYYCETTNTAYNIGITPPEIEKAELKEIIII